MHSVLGLSQSPSYRPRAATHVTNALFMLQVTSGILSLFFSSVRSLSFLCILIRYHFAGEISRSPCLDGCVENTQLNHASRWQMDIRSPLKLDVVGNDYHVSCSPAKVERVRVIHIPHVPNPYCGVNGNLPSQCHCSVMRILPSLILRRMVSCSTYRIIVIVAYFCSILTYSVSMLNVFLIGNSLLSRARRLPCL